MYGMIHQAVRDLAITQFGRDDWDRLAVANGLTSQDFIGVDYYPDTETFSLVHLISRHSGKSFEDSLFEIGFHLLTFIGSSAYSRILNMAGDDMDSFFTDLDLMHTSIKVNMPMASLPSFRIAHLDGGTTEILYSSSRQNFAPFVRGLISAVAARFHETVEIDQFVHANGILFKIRRVVPHA